MLNFAIFLILSKTSLLSVINYLNDLLYNINATWNAEVDMGPINGNFSGCLQPSSLNSASTFVLYPLLLTLISHISSMIKYFAINKRFQHLVSAGICDNK
jgi:hypothetical protein